MEIERLHFSVRTYNCLKRKGIHTVEQLEKMSDDELMSIRGFGVGCLAEVRWQIDKPPMTNADRIRAMSDEELAVFIHEPFCDKRTHEECTITYCGVCNQCALDWLQQPSEEVPDNG